jgi:hypothetical protein
MSVKREIDEQASESITTILLRLIKYERNHDEMLNLKYLKYAES